MIYYFARVSGLQCNAGQNVKVKQEIPSINSLSNSIKLQILNSKPFNAGKQLCNRFVELLDCCVFLSNPGYFLPRKVAKLPAGPQQCKDINKVKRKFTSEIRAN